MRKTLIILVLVMMAICLAQSRSSGQRKKRPSAQTPQAPTYVTEQTAEINARGQSGIPFAPEEKAQLIAKLLANPRMMEKLRNQRARVLSVTLVSIDKAPTVQLPDKRIAQVVLFNYSVNRASRLLVEASSGEVLSDEPVRGRPQSSAEEIEEADKIIRQDRTLARLLENKGVLEGGFIVDAPPGANRQHRFIQRLLLTDDRLNLQRVVVVDLTSGTVASSKAGQIR